MESVRVKILARLTKTAAARVKNIAKKAFAIVVLYVKDSAPEYKCFACGGKLFWGADFMKSEIEGCDESEDTVVMCFIVRIAEQLYTYITL